ncbi:MAG: hypothetical protein R3C11_10780 [Planctomycetaceae bacterium]
MSFDLEPLQNILACPKCRSKLIQDDTRVVCRNADCRLAFEVLDDIPVMLIDEAQQLVQEEWETVLHKLDKPAESNGQP